MTDLKTWSPFRFLRHDANQPNPPARLGGSRKKREQQVALPRSQEPGSGFVIPLVQSHDSGSNVAVREYFWRAWT